MEPSPGESLYFVGVGLPALESAFFTKLKQKHLPPGKALSPAHITLKPPFLYPNETRLVEILTKFVKSKRPFQAEFTNIGTFEQKKYATLYLQPDKGEDFKRLASDLDTVLPFLPPTNNFHPHLTLANFIPLDNLDNLKSTFRSLNLKLKLSVASLTLFSKSDEADWRVKQEFPFSGRS